MSAKQLQTIGVAALVAGSACVAGAQETRVTDAFGHYFIAINGVSSGSEFLEHRVCNQSGTASSFIWPQAGFGVSDWNRLPTGYCASITRLISGTTPQDSLQLLSGEIELGSGMRPPAWAWVDCRDRWLSVHCDNQIFANIQLTILLRFFLSPPSDDYKEILPEDEVIFERTISAAELGGSEFGRVGISFSSTEAWDSVALLYDPASSQVSGTNPIEILDNESDFLFVESAISEVSDNLSGYWSSFRQAPTAAIIGNPAASETSSNFVVVNSLATQSPAAIFTSGGQSIPSMFVSIGGQFPGFQ
jgi:hypothetical protein